MELRGLLNNSSFITENGQWQIEGANMFIICRRNTEVKEVQIFFKFPLLCLLNCCTGGDAEESHEHRSLTEVANGQ